MARKPESTADAGGEEAPVETVTAEEFAELKKRVAALERRADASRMIRADD